MMSYYKTLLFIWPVVIIMVTFIVIIVIDSIVVDKFVLRA